MSIASEITRINTNIANAYTACDGKGATMPASGSQNSANLATTISSIPVGGDGIPREVVNGVYQMPASSFTFSLPSNATSLGGYALAFAFTNCTALTSADLSSLTSITEPYSLYYTFRDCSNLTNVDLSNLTTVNGSQSGSQLMPGALRYTGITTLDLSGLTSVGAGWAFNYFCDGCQNLTSVNLSNLTTIEGQSAFEYAFSNCPNLSSVTFTNLTRIGYTPVETSTTQQRGQFRAAFKGSTSLKSLSFPELTKIYCNYNLDDYGTFSGNNYIEKMYFPKLNTITYGAGASSAYQTSAKNIFSGCTSLTELHFGAANESAIKATAGWSTAWGRGAGNVTIYFDL